VRAVRGSPSWNLSRLRIVTPTVKPPPRPFFAAREYPPLANSWPRSGATPARSLAATVRVQAASSTAAASGPATCSGVPEAVTLATSMRPSRVAAPGYRQPRERHRVADTRQHEGRSGVADGLGLTSRQEHNASRQGSGPFRSEGAGSPGVAQGGAVELATRCPCTAKAGLRRRSPASAGCSWVGQSRSFSGV
jgi:hypothetical protein